MAIIANLPAAFRRAAALPDDGRGHRLAGLANQFGNLPITGHTPGSAVYQQNHRVGFFDSQVDLPARLRIDIDRIQQQVDYPLAPVVMNSSEDGESGLPIAVDSPAFADEGPHLAYAIQWFAFALIGLVGYFFLMRRTVKRSG